MTVITEAAVLDALRHVQEPELGRDIVTLDMLVTANQVTTDAHIGTAADVDAAA